MVLVLQQRMLRCCLFAKATFLSVLELINECKGEVDGWMKVQHKVKINKVRIWIRWFVKVYPEGFDDPGLRVSSLFEDVDVFIPSKVNWSRWEL
jgi:hypothetical protein